MLALRGERFKEVEILLLRHQVAVRCTPSDATALRRSTTRSSTIWATNGLQRQTSAGNGERTRPAFADRVHEQQTGFMSSGSAENSRSDAIAPEVGQAQVCPLRVNEAGVLGVPDALNPKVVAPPAGMVAL
ncbi:hypothetical protein Pen02_56670 [Plantactinospora endophytica]|uniref:Uncharacterized protein n=1 Tax=Plantactinospora endophytica TaxID=673535 RepID=A0ABQ4E7N1_9ACTN|nr:hypothetical protein Pen02_56670 [Plantactinospora endophytica]